MQVIKEEGAAPIKAWVGSKSVTTYLAGEKWGYGNVPDIEDSALTQLKNVARLPFIARNGIAVMPDCHWGNGASVGSVIAAVDAVIPSAVGVDIGCGMCAIRLSLKASDLPESLLKIRQQIERDVPTGNNMHRNADHCKGLEYTPRPLSLQSSWGKIGGNLDRAAQQLGTLGGGNHFIELCIDENQDVWVMLHSGSRGIGNQIGRYFIDRAKELCARWHVDLPHGDLAFLPAGDPVFDEYIEAVEWAQAYRSECKPVFSVEHVVARPAEMTFYGPVSAPMMRVSSLDMEPGLVDIRAVQMSRFSLASLYPEQPAEEIIVEPATVMGLLEQIKQLQAPDLARIREENRKRDARDRVHEVRHATILSFAA